MKLIRYLKVTCMMLSSLVCNDLLIAQTNKFLSDWSMRRSYIAARQVFANTSSLSVKCRNDYGLKELTDVRLTGIFVLEHNMLQASLSHYGYSRYGELWAEIAYSRNFSDKVGLSLRFYYLYGHASGYDASHSVTFDVSLFLKASNKLAFWVDVYNPARMKYGIVGKELIPMSFLLGISYCYEDKLIFVVSMEKQLPGNFNATFEFYYAPIQKLNFLCSLSLESVRVGFLLSLKNFNLSVDLGYQYNLGFIPELEATVLFDKFHYKK